jgi:predicted small metal-binding protein
MPDKLSMLNCRYYGFECNFEVEGKLDKISEEMKRHTLYEHRIDYSKEFLTQIILRKKS